MESHVTAQRALSNFELTAAATRYAGSARAAAEAFGAGDGYDDICNDKLVQSEQVAIVAVSVEVRIV